MNAYNSWASVKASGGIGAERAFCSRNFLSPAGMNMLEGMRGQLLSELLNRGLIASLRAASVNAADAGLVRFVLVRACSLSKTQRSCMCIDTASACVLGSWRQVPTMLSCQAVRAKRDVHVVAIRRGAGFIPDGVASSAAAGTTGSRPGSPPC